MSGRGVSFLQCGLIIALAAGVVGCPREQKSIGGFVPPETILVEGGTFTMGDAYNAGTIDEKPLHAVNLSDFEIGVYEITNQQFADVLNWALANNRYSKLNVKQAQAFGQPLIFLGATSCRITYTGSQFIVETLDGFSMADHPVTQVSWYGAALYCNWLSEIVGLEPSYDTSNWNCQFSATGYRLPTEAEWEYAAGWTGSAQFRYANGRNTVNCTSANVKQSEFCNPFNLTLIPLSAPVGFYNGLNGTVHSVSPAGLYDMAGNVWEWCNDWYDPAYYASSPANNPRGATVGTERVIRGGSWLAKTRNARTAERNKFAPAKGHDDKGFRVAR